LSCEKQENQKAVSSAQEAPGNWGEYNAALVKRGSLTIWLDEVALVGWFHHEKSGRRGASLTYSDAAIEAVLLLKAVYRLPLRGAQGLAESLLRLMDLKLPIPHFSILSRRQVGLELVMPCLRTGEAIQLVVDSTGCKVYGEGEWNVRAHGKSKRRTWRKLHLGMDEKTGEIVAAVLSSNNLTDSEALSQLLEQVEAPIAQLSGDGGYDKRPCYELLQQRQEEQEQSLKVTIPPRRGARIWKHGNSKEQRLVRDENLREIRRVGRRRWKRESGYHRRSLAETAISRYKRIVGDKLRAREFKRQCTEAFVGGRDAQSYDDVGRAEKLRRLKNQNQGMLRLNNYSCNKAVIMIVRTGGFLGERKITDFVGGGSSDSTE
jgi:hypothetical protein